MGLYGAPMYLGKKVVANICLCYEQNEKRCPLGGTLKCTSFGNGKWYKVWRLNIVQRLAMENGTKIKLTEIGYLDNMNIAQ